MPLPRAARTDAELPDAFDGRLFDLFVASESEVVVSGQIKAFLPVYRDVFAGLEKRSCEWPDSGMAVKLIKLNTLHYSVKQCNVPD